MQNGGLGSLYFIQPKKGRVMELFHDLKNIFLYFVNMLKINHLSYSIYLNIV